MNQILKAIAKVLTEAGIPNIPINATNHNSYIYINNTANTANTALYIKQHLNTIALRNWLSITPNSFTLYELADPQSIPNLISQIKQLLLK